MSSKKGINLKISEDIKENFKILANLKGISTNQYIVDLISNEIKENKKNN
ncbi:MAG: toxin-antitoxin system HicB family antitoxin [Methanobrevibacter sp.]|jgi:predicted HicB family RNase H-like nuclease|nr:toxin-antitoxin system HicB family antitoxin [Methanobrevibacter sp.]